jgi:hypothetical protein
MLVIVIVGSFFAVVADQDPGIRVAAELGTAIAWRPWRVSHTGRA